MGRYLIVCPMIFLAGFVDSIAGGGGLISFPAYMLAGIPIHVTIGTSKLSAFPGSIVAAARFAKGGYIRLKLAICCAIAGIVGALIGAQISLHVNEKIIQSLMLVVLPVVAFCVLRNKGDEDDSAKRELPENLLIPVCIAVSVVIGAFNGFYGPGTGTFLIIAFANIARLRLKESAGLAKVVNFCADFSAMSTFFLNDKVDYRLGLAAAVFGVAGNYFGSGLVVNNGQKIVRPVIIIVLVLLFAKILTGQ